MNDKNALNNLANGLESIKNRLWCVRESAREGGLQVAESSISNPVTVVTPPADGCSASGGGREDPKAALYKELEAETSDIRVSETEVRQAFADACANITAANHPVREAAPGVIRPNIRSGGVKAAVNTANWAIGRASNVTTLTQGIALSKANPRLTTDVGNGKLRTSHAARGGKPVGRPRLRFHDGDLGNWKPGGRFEESTAAKVASKAGKVGKGLKVAGAAGSVATGGGGWADGWAGAEAGAAIGVCVGGPVGAAVGGVVGGAVGGVAGSAAGSLLADQANNGIHSAAKWFH